LICARRPAPFRNCENNHGANREAILARLAWARPSGQPIRNHIHAFDWPATADALYSVGERITENVAMSDGKLGRAASRTWTYFDGAWREGNVPIMGPRTHAAWLGSTVFDGARAFEGMVPDLELHCARINHSATEFHLAPTVSVERWISLVKEGLSRFAENAALYIRPMYWAEHGIGGGVRFDPDSTQWCLCIYESPMPEPKGSAITLSPFRRPTPDSAPLSAKASCLYPNNGRALLEAHARGFDNCVLCDALGNVAELANANIFMARDGVVYTPVPNGTFLDGITRRRVASLLRGDGVEVVERSLSFSDFEQADEIFSTGNYLKVYPMIRIEDRPLAPGPLYRRARELYWDYARRSAQAAR
jgi:branched-chain amino acid aminotransferase